MSKLKYWCAIIVIVASIPFTSFCSATEQVNVSTARGERVLRGSPELERQLTGVRKMSQRIEKTCKAIPHFSESIQQRISFCDNKACISEALKQYEAEENRLLAACVDEAKRPTSGRTKGTRFTNVLHNYDIEVTPLKSCTDAEWSSPQSDGSCSEPARLSIHRKGDKRALQSWIFAEHRLPLGDGKSTINITNLYDAQSEFNVDDFNFDGREDFAVVEGYNGSYNGPTYAVFLDGPNGFVLHQGLSELTQSSLGFFSVDAKTKTLQTFSKSGCCDHWKTTYEMPNNEVLPVMEEREFLRPDGMGEVTKSRFVDGKWHVETRKKFRPQSYCEDFVDTLASRLLHFRKLTNYNYPKFCALMPGHPNWVIFTTLYPKRNIIDDLNRDDQFKGMDVMVADKESESALATYQSEEQFGFGKLSAYDAVIDTAPYVLQKGLRAFGIRNEFSGVDNKLQFQRLNLFLINGSALSNVLSNLVVGIRGKNYSLNRVLIVDALTHNGFADIIVSETRIEFTEPDERGNVKEVARSKQKYRLEYVGQQYVVPSGLQSVH